jgi:hypothetical protein
MFEKSNFLNSYYNIQYSETNTCLLPFTKDIFGDPFSRHYAIFGQKRGVFSKSVLGLGNSGYDL